MAQLTIKKLNEFLSNYTDDTVILFDANGEGYVDADHIFTEIVKDLGDDYEKINGITKGRYNLVSLKELQEVENLNEEENMKDVIIISRKKDLDLQSLMFKVDNIKPIKVQ